VTAPLKQWGKFFNVIGYIVRESTLEDIEARRAA